MNFFPNIPIDYLINKINELESRIRILEQKIKSLENNENKHQEPDNYLYMV